MSKNEQQAREKVENSPALSRFYDFIFSDWPNWEEHIEWILTASEAEILDWRNGSI